MEVFMIHQQPLWRMCFGNIVTTTLSSSIKEEFNVKKTQMEPSNYYEEKSKRQFVNENKKTTKEKLMEAEEKSGDWKETAKDVGTDLVVGVLGGGLAAAAIGKPSLLVGLVISGYAHHTKNKILSALGLGMMASGTMSALTGKSQAPNMADRLGAFKDELKRKLFLDKLLPTKKPSLEGINSLTEEKREIVVPTASDFAMNEKTKSEAIDIHTELNGSQISIDKYFDWDFNERIY